MSEPRKRTTIEHMTVIQKADNATLFVAMRSVAALSAYLASGCILSSEERDRIQHAAAEIESAAKDAAADAGQQIEPL